MNELFVNVKVDREERPDVDAIYMEAVQAMTGHGGWPMTVFLTPDGRPVLRRHLLPDGAAAGCPASSSCCQAVDEAWRNRRDDLADQAGQLTERPRPGGAWLGAGRRTAARAARCSTRGRGGAAAAASTPSGAASAGAQVPPDR